MVQHINTTRLVCVLASVLQSDWVPDFRFRVQKVIRKHTRLFPARPVTSVPENGRERSGSATPDYPPPYKKP